MNTLDDLVRMRIDALLEQAGGLRRERDLRAGAEAAETMTLATAAGPTIAAGHVAEEATPSSDCPECPSAVRAA
jgi:hypothetical protein